MGKTPDNVIVTSIYMDRDIHEKIKQWAEDDGRSMSYFVCAVLRGYIDGTL